MTAATPKWTKEEIDASFAEQVVALLLKAGRTRADSVVPTDGPSINFNTWVLNALAARDAAIADASRAS